MSKAIANITKMLAVGTPLIAVDSYDHPDTIARLRVELAKKDARPQIEWNVADGYKALNDEAVEVLNGIPEPKKKAAAQGPHAALHVALDFPETTVLIMSNLHWFWDKPAVMQAMLNVREPFKSTKRAVIALCLNAKVPADLVQNVSYVEDALPKVEELTERVKKIGESIGGIDDESAGLIAGELRGTSPFRAEQLAYQSLTRDGIDREKLRDNARKQINDTAGLSVETGDENFDSIGDVLLWWCESRKSRKHWQVSGRSRLGRLVTLWERFLQRSKIIAGAARSATE